MGRGTAWRGILGCALMLLSCTLGARVACAGSRPGDSRSGGRRSVNPSDVVAGDTFRDGVFRTYASEHSPEEWPGVRPPLSLSTPRYPPAARTLHKDWRSDVSVRVGSDGEVDSVFGFGESERPGSEWAQPFDSAAVAAAWLCRWPADPEPSARMFLSYSFVDLPDLPGGRGDLLVRTFDTVAHDPIRDAYGGLWQTKVGTTRQQGDAFRLVDAPAGIESLDVDGGWMRGKRLAVTIRRDVCDTVDVIVSPRFAVPAGARYFRIPPAPLPSRPEDAARLPRKGFRIVFATGRGERIDSKAGVVTKDEVSAPDLTTRLVFTPAELDRIYREAMAIHVLDIPEPHPPIDQRFMRMPHTTLHLEVASGDTTRTFDWDTSDRDECYFTDDWKRLDELIGLIRKIVRNRPEWRALPEPQALYQ